MPLKNIAEPMRAYSLEFGAPREARSPPPADQAKSAPKRRSSLASLAAAATLLLLVAAGGWYCAPVSVETSWALTVMFSPTRPTLPSSI